MTASNHYKYIGLDFETTGLDVNKDEPIQIGIVTLDEQGNVKEKFQSLIKPNKKTDELKHIVWFITGLSIADLEHAPTRNDILPQIEKFFDENTIIIGHNIKFDLDFLEKYFPTLKYRGSIDTYKLAQYFVHYAPSYALEVLVTELSNKEPTFKEFLKLAIGGEHSSDESHDALYDTLESIALHNFFVSRISLLTEKYASLYTILQQSDWLFAEAIASKIQNPKSKIHIKFPSLQRLSPQNISLSSKSHLDNLENQKRYYIGNTTIKETLTSIASQKNVILAFQNIQKLDIAKMVLNDIGIKNIWFIKEDQSINEEMFTNFLNKGRFTEDECLFVCKYLSHLDKGYGTLDLNNSSDRKIYYTIKDTKDKTRYPVILATHSGVYSMMKEENHFPDYDIFFFDTERRYKTYNFFLSRPSDLYYTLNLIESLIYREQVALEILNSKNNSQLSTTEDFNSQQDETRINVLNDFHNFFQILIWILSTETKKIFTKTEAIYIPHDPIIDHGDFYQTNQMRKQLPDHIEKVKAAIGEEAFAPVEKQIQQIDHIFNNVMNISKKMYSQSDFYFVYAEAQRYTDRKEFTETFTNTIYFLSNNNKEYIPLLDKGEVKGGFVKVQPISTKIPTRNLDKIDEISKHIQTNQKEDQNIFIFSPRKEESQKIFEDLCQKGIHEQTLILVENITGWIGKNVFKANGKGKKLIIWWNNFLLYLYADGTKIDEIILFNSKWWSEQSILQDIQRYYPK